MAKETNEEFVVRIMNFGCPTGALIQPFMLEALRAYSNSVAYGIQPEDWPDTSVISFEAWQRTGRWVLNEVEAHYGHEQSEVRTPS